MGNKTQYVVSPAFPFGTSVHGVGGCKTIFPLGFGASGTEQLESGDFPTPTWYFSFSDPMGDANSNVGDMAVTPGLNVTRTTGAFGYGIQEDPSVGIISHGSGTGVEIMSSVAISFWYWVPWGILSYPAGYGGVRVKSGTNTVLSTSFQMSTGESSNLYLNVTYGDNVSQAVVGNNSSRGELLNVFATIYYSGSHRYLRVYINGNRVMSEGTTDFDLRGADATEVEFIGPYMMMSDVAVWCDASVSNDSDCDTLASSLYAEGRPYIYNPSEGGWVRIPYTLDSVDRLETPVTLTFEGNFDFLGGCAYWTNGLSAPDTKLLLLTRNVFMLLEGGLGKSGTDGNITRWAYAATDGSGYAVPWLPVAPTWNWYGYAITVTGAGTVDVDGIFHVVGWENGLPIYQNDDHANRQIKYDVGSDTWILWAGAVAAYSKVATDSIYPEDGAWSIKDGAGPAPSSTAALEAPFA